MSCFDGLELGFRRSTIGGFKYDEEAPLIDSKDADKSRTFTTEDCLNTCCSPRVSQAAAAIFGAVNALSGSAMIIGTQVADVAVNSSLYAGLMCGGMVMLIGGGGGGFVLFGYLRNNPEKTCMSYCTARKHVQLEG